MKYHFLGLISLLATVVSANNTCEPDLTNDAAADQFEADPITILAQDEDTVTFTVSQTWSDELLCLISIHFTDETDEEVCPYASNAGPGDIDTYTAKCVDGVAAVDLYVYDPIFVTSNSPAIDAICEQTPAAETYKYEYEIPCTATADCPAPVTCADVASTTIDFESADDASAWLFGGSGTDDSGNKYLKLDADTVEVSKTFDTPTDGTTSVTFQFDFLPIEFADDQIVLIRVGDFYLNMTNTVSTLVPGDSRTYFYGDIETTSALVGMSSIVRTSIKIPASLYSEGQIDLGLRTTSATSSTFVAGVDNVSVVLECEQGFDDGDKAGGGGGDPHFSTWDQDHFTFHGECDLIMVHSDKFQNGAGLDLHVRTTIQDYFSFIESAALRVGETIAEFHNNHFYLDGVKYQPSDLPMAFGNEATIRVGELEAGKNPRFYQYYEVDLNDRSSMVFKFYKQFMTVSIRGHGTDFADSIGLIGDYGTGNKVSRDGEVMTNADEYGFEWQVQPGADGMLFQDADRSPQLPYEQCRMPTAARPSRRKLRGADAALFQSALSACAHVSGADFDLCTDDVMATGDLGLATMW